MKKQEWNEGMNHIDPELVTFYVEEKDRLAKKRKAPAVWLRMGAVAACAALILGAVVALPMMWEKDPGPLSTPSETSADASALPTPGETAAGETETGKISQGEPWWGNPPYSAQGIAELFGKTLSDSISTNAYTKVYAPDPRYLYIYPMSDDEYLDLYRCQEINAPPINKEEMKGFVDRVLPKLAAAMNVDVPEYEIRERAANSLWESSLHIYQDIGNKRISVNQGQTSCSFGIYSNSNGGKLMLDGEAVEVDQRLSDEEIIDSLQSVKEKLFDIFGVSFTDAKIYRGYDSYSENGATFINVYFYNEAAHPLNQKRSRPWSDYIVIDFDNFSNYADDVVSDSVLTVVSINYYQYRIDVSKQYVPFANTKKISLEEAEALLYQGYVFGNHACALCMAQQEEITFDGYDFVGMEYVFGRDYEKSVPSVGVPFYVFYKEIGTASNGNIIYAKTYVAAVEVEGYEAYFEQQKSQHRN